MEFKKGDIALVLVGLGDASWTAGTLVEVLEDSHREWLLAKPLSEVPPQYVKYDFMYRTSDLILMKDLTELERVIYGL